MKMLYTRPVSLHKKLQGIGTLIVFLVAICSWECACQTYSPLTTNIRRIFGRAQLEKFVSHFINPCHVVPLRLPASCEDALKDIPSIFSTFADDAEQIPADFPRRFCSACPEEELLAIFDALVASFESGSGYRDTSILAMDAQRLADPTCDNTVTGTQYLREMTQILFRLLCSQHDSGSYCMEPYLLPRALKASGLMRMLTSMDSSSGLQRATQDAFSTGMFDFIGLCQHLQPAGCCMQVISQSVYSLGELNCMGGPLIQGWFEGIGSCDGGDTCPGWEPVEYRAPEIGNGCPGIGFFTSVDRISKLKPIRGSFYEGCLQPEDSCPANACQLLRCKSMRSAYPPLKAASWADWLADHQPSRTFSAAFQPFFTQGSEATG